MGNFADVQILFGDRQFDTKVKGIAAINTLFLK